MAKKTIVQLEKKLELVIEELKEHKDQSVQERLRKINELLCKERCQKNIAGLRHEVVGVFHVLSYLRTLGEKIPGEVMRTLQSCEQDCDCLYKKLKD